MYTSSKLVTVLRQVQRSGGAPAESEGNPGGLAGPVPVLQGPGGGVGLAERPAARHGRRGLRLLAERHPAAAAPPPGMMQ